MGQHQRPRQLHRRSGFATQGTERLINGARIEHASVGIDAGSRAIVSIDNAVFYNCLRGEVFRPCHNRELYPLSPIHANESRITHSTFEINGQLRQPLYNQQGHAMAPVFSTAKGIEGFGVYGSTFINQLLQIIPNIGYYTKVNTYISFFNFHSRIKQNRVS